MELQPSQSPIKPLYQSIMDIYYDLMGRFFFNYFRLQIVYMIIARMELREIQTDEKEILN